MKFCRNCCRISYPFLLTMLVTAAIVRDGAKGRLHGHCPRGLQRSFHLVQRSLQVRFLLILDLVQALLHEAEDHIPADEAGKDVIAQEGQLPGRVPNGVQRNGNKEGAEKAMVEEHGHAERLVSLDRSEEHTSELQ